MFDLAELLKKDSPQQRADTTVNTVLFFQTPECSDLVLEAYRFEGIGDPAVLDNRDTNIAKYVENHQAEIVLVELNTSSDVGKDAERISHLLPNNASVIIIGSEDAISTIRALKALGFYYLFWPVTKQELIDFVKSVTENRNRQIGVGQNRKAKHVALVGTKGGVGCSLLSAEVSYVFADDKKSGCVLVNHNYAGGNLDIMLAKRDLEKRELQSGTLAATLDGNAARSLLTKIGERLEYLALGSEEVNHSEVRELTETVVELVSKDANFVVEDLSSSVSFFRDPGWLCDKYDCIVLILEPTVSSLREAAILNIELNKHRKDHHDHAIRIITVLNHNRPEKSASITDAEIEKYLGHKPDIVLPYVSSLNEQILRGEHIYLGKSQMSKQIKGLVKLIMGEALAEKSWFGRLLGR
ncbi:hypothetical protein NF212_11430 [Parasalinivibrio latis]|uniref:AAA family ATPase n=1 Tax=Parasalinivibrio latis TaxID=2952610 RepID=UPI0030DEC8F0